MKSQNTMIIQLGSDDKQARYDNYKLTLVHNLEPKTKNPKAVKQKKVSGKVAHSKTQYEGLLRTTSGKQVQVTNTLKVKGDSIAVDFGEDLFDQVKSVFVTLYGPDGQNLHTEILQRKAIEKYVKGDKPHHIFLENPWKVVNVPVIENQHSGKAIHLRGRLLAKSGKAVSGSHQIIISARGDKEDFYPVFQARTNPSGYFFGDFPRGNFKEAYATVASNPKEQIVIKLEDGKFPENILLMIELSEEQLVGEGEVLQRNPDTVDLVTDSESFTKDPSKDNCFDFTAPNRIIQEHSFYTVVRTSDPEIAPYDFKKEDNDSQKSSVEKSRVLENIPVETIDPDSYHIPGNVDLPQTINEGIDPDDLVPNTVIETLEVNEEPLRRLRKKVSEYHQIDWEDEKSLYQATSVAHGHILQYKVKWKADGYSLGDLLYSLPLAPCQKKQVAIVDWDRRDRGLSRDNVQARDQLVAEIERNRDIEEIVRATLGEALDGGSNTSTSSGGGGGGFSVDFGLFSIGGGGSGATSSAESDAFQQSERSIGALSAQQLADRIVQSASSVRNQRTTTISTVTQGENTAVTTEVVHNHNHCHAMTVEYFEVLRHMKVITDLVDVQECLFIPLIMSPFDHNKILKWEPILKRQLKERALSGAFEAIERIENGSDLPQGQYADEIIHQVDGHFFVNIDLRADVPEETEVQKKIREDHFAKYVQLLEINEIQAKIYYDNFVKKYQEDQQTREFLDQEASEIARRIVDDLQVLLIRKDGQPAVPLESTLTTPYESGKPLTVDIAARNALGSLTRADISAVLINLPGSLSSYGVSSKSRVFVGTGQISYTTDHLSGELITRSALGGDLAEEHIYVAATRLNDEELANPREEDRLMASKLLNHLNENLEYYHKWIWLKMDPNKRYRMLESFTAPGSRRSLSSVVENKVIGVAGNSLIMPVARGFKLDPKYDYDASDPNALLNLYAPEIPTPATHIAMPTKGVFAEAKLGSCNSCEEIDDSRFWKWHEVPCGDEPTPILPASTASRNDPGRQAPVSQGLGQPIINLQNAPAAPDPTGLQGALNLLGNAGLFRDITGLANNQTNAGNGISANLQAAQAFAEQAAKVNMQQTMSKDIDRLSRSLQNNVAKGIISQEEANNVLKKAYANWAGDTSQPEKTSLTSDSNVGKLIERASNSGKSNVTLERDGEKVDVSFEDEATERTEENESLSLSYPVELIPQTDKLSCWAASMAMLLGYRRNQSVNPEELANEVNFSLRQSYHWDELEDVKDHFGFQEIALPSNTSLYPSPEDWYNWLDTYGPLWVTIKGAPSHALVVHGISGDLSEENTHLELLNPWDIDQVFSSDEIDFDPVNEGKAYMQNFEEFAADFGQVGLENYGEWRILYLPDGEAPDSNEPQDEAPEGGLPGAAQGSDFFTASPELQVGDRDRVTGEQGAEQSGNPIYEGTEITQGLDAYDAKRYVFELQSLLKSLGFSITGTPDGDFGTKTEYALKEFQVYAKMGWVAQQYREVGTDAMDQYLYTLKSVSNGAQLPENYPISGVLSVETLTALQYWIANDYRCPVVVHAYHDDKVEAVLDRSVLPAALNNLSQNDDLMDYLRKPKPNAMPENENAWGYDEPPTSSTYRYFTYDFTRYYEYDVHSDYRYNYHNPANDLTIDEMPHVTVLGSSPRPGSKYSRGGYQTKPRLHTWYTARITPESLLGKTTISADERKLAEVILQVSKFEAGGYWDRINGYDSGLISIGLFHHILANWGRSNHTWSAKGEGAKIIGMMDKSGDDYQQFIDFFGLHFDRPVGAITNGRYGNNNAGMRFHTRDVGVYSAVYSEKFNSITDAKNRSILNFLKSTHWFYRWTMMMRTSTDVRTEMFNAAKLRLNTIWEQIVAKGVQDKFDQAGLIGVVLRSHAMIPSKLGDLLDIKPPQGEQFVTVRQLVDFMEKHGDRQIEESKIFDLYDGLGTDPFPSQVIGAVPNEVTP